MRRIEPALSAKSPYQGMAGQIRREIRSTKHLENASKIPERVKQIGKKQREKTL
jgi:hypothetical protein